MKPMMQSRYVGWMAVRPLTFGDEKYAPGDRVPQRHLDDMRDPEVLLRTGRIKAVAKDMNKVPRMLRKDVTLEEEMRDKILGPRAATQIGPVVPGHLVDTIHDPNSDAYAKALEEAAELEEAARLEAEEADLESDEEPVELAPAPPLAVPSVEVGDPVPTHGVKHEDLEISDEPDDEEPVVEDSDEDKNGPETTNAQVSAGAPEDTPEDTEDDDQAGQVTVNPVQEPAKSASTEAWVTFAKGSGATDEDIDGMNRAELIEKYGTKEAE